METIKFCHDCNIGYPITAEKCSYKNIIKDQEHTLVEELGKKCDYCNSYILADEQCYCMDYYGEW